MSGVKKEDGGQEGADQSNPGDQTNADGSARAKLALVDKTKRKGKKAERVFDWPKKNYFEVTRHDSTDTERMKSLVHRVVYISKLRDEDIDRVEAGNYYERQLKNLQNVHQSVSVTGLMLIYMKHIVHVVETSSDMLLEIVKDLHYSQTSDQGFISKAKILVISHDIPQRLYQQWSFRTLDIEAHRLEAFEPSETTDKLIIDVLTQLLKLGKFISKTPKLNFKNAMDSLHQNVPEFLPQQAAIHYLLEEDDNCMLLPSEYINTYTKPFDTALDSDKVWPLPTRLFPYN
ncbi:testis-expressed protein 47-like isoform X1 [Haliotis rufescens]|uniref:testis-expressed protein 47-like isoform X1 n=1 Tax=Haliotis rufescens TaxID=6454 RepID=UPI00201F26F3|nr:testis-expressed protein 47-like isoform X1 [Haliotis rufescens]